MTMKPSNTALCATMIGLIVTANAHAQTYPTTSTTTTTTRTSSSGNYRPLTLSFDTVYEEIALSPTLTYRSGVDLSPAVSRDPPAGLPGGTLPPALFRYTAVLGGDFATTGASIPETGKPITGDAGYWLFVLDPNWMAGFDVSYQIDLNPVDFTQTAIAEAAIQGAQQRAGFLVYLGEDPGDLSSYAGVPYEDTPQVGDLFWLYLDDGESMEFRWDDFIGSLDDFLGGSGAYKATWTASDPFEHLGPFTPSEACKGDWRACAYAGLYGLGDQDFEQLDAGRLNAECETSTGFAPCGSVSAVPLPAALPLFGTALGLLAVAGYRRRRATS